MDVTQIEMQMVVGFTCLVAVRQDVEFRGHVAGRRTVLLDDRLGVEQRVADPVDIGGGGPLVRPRDRRKPVRG